MKESDKVMICYRECPNNAQSGCLHIARLHYKSSLCGEHKCEEAPAEQVVLARMADQRILELECFGDMV